MYFRIKNNLISDNIVLIISYYGGVTTKSIISYEIVKDSIFEQEKYPFLTLFPTEGGGPPPNRYC